MTLTAEPDTLIPMTEVERRSGLSRSTIYTEMRADRFPLPLKMPGGKAVRWKASEIDGWIDALPRATGDLNRQSKE